MDALYSLTLLVALVASAAAALAGVLAARGRFSRLRRVAVWGGALALAVGVCSCAVHWHFGHGPASPEPMALGRFLGNHPAYGIAGLLSLFAVGVAVATGQRD